MQKKSEQTTPFWLQAAQSPWVEGPVLGASVMALITPLLKWTNHAYKDEKMPKGNLFSGAKAYALSAVPGYATTFAFKALLNNRSEKISQEDELTSSFFAGALSGLVCTPFEALAQNEQLTQSSSSKKTAEHMLKNHGYSAFFRGGVSIMLREGLWSSIYLTAIPMMSTALQKQGVEKRYAQPLATLAVAGTFGLFSSPLNQLRYRKQAGLTMPNANKSYLTHTLDILKEAPKGSGVTQQVARLFKASLPRAVSTTVGAGLLVEGATCYKEALEHFKP